MKEIKRLRGSINSIKVLIEKKLKFGVNLTTIRRIR